MASSLKQRPGRDPETAQQIRNRPQRRNTNHAFLGWREGLGKAHLISAGGFEVVAEYQNVVRTLQYYIGMQSLQSEVDLFFQ